MRIAAASASAACASASLSHRQLHVVAPTLQGLVRDPSAVSPAHVREAISAASVASATISSAAAAAAPEGSSGPEAACARRSRRLRERADARAFWRASSAFAMRRLAFKAGDAVLGRALGRRRWPPQPPWSPPRRLKRHRGEADALLQVRVDLLALARGEAVAAVAPPSASCASSSDRPETFPAEPEAAVPAVPARPAGGETKEEESACSATARRGLRRRSCRTSGRDHPSP